MPTRNPRPGGARQSAAGQRLRGKSNAANKPPGINSAAAQTSIVRQYGLVKNEEGKWVKPDAAFLERQLAAQGWGVGQTAATPVNIGGARWLTGAGKLVFTNQRSDSAKRNPGAAYNATGGQISYSKSLGKGKGGKGQGKRDSIGKYRGAGPRGGGAGGTPGIGPDVPPIIAPSPGSPESFITGVSGKTGQFITEKGGAGPAGEESEAGSNRTHRKKKGRNKKLVKRVVKKTPVKGKVVRKALRSPGITAHDKKVYARVAKTAPKLSSRLRRADRRGK